MPLCDNVYTVPGTTVSAGMITICSRRAPHAESLPETDLSALGVRSRGADDITVRL